MKRYLLIQILCLAVVAIVAIALTSCNVTRTVTNESTYVQKGDTSTTIKTKTVESYSAIKK